MFEFIVYVALSLSVLITYLAFSRIINYHFVYRKSDFTGFWKCSILDNNNNVVKIDYCHLLHDKRSGKFIGNIIRQYPEAQSYRKWYCNGVLYDRKIIMSFWSAHDTYKSDGSGYLFLTDDWTFEGVYMHGTKTNKIATVNVISQKVRNPDEIRRIQKLLTVDPSRNNDNIFAKLIPSILGLCGFVLVGVSIIALIPPISHISAPVFSWIQSSSILTTTSNDAIIGILIALGLAMVSASFTLAKKE